jgi:hypothetical protein
MKKRILLIVWGLAVAIGISYAILPINIQNSVSQFETMDYEGNPKAVIIDQLYNDIPNEEFHKTVTKYLNDEGYKVDIFTTDEITVDFYKQLPSMNYEFIVIRGHSLGYGSIENSASLFTGEKYDKHKYIKEQFLGHVSRGVSYFVGDIAEYGGRAALEDQTYFVVGSKLVDEAMVGQFPGSTIILAGCDTSKKTVLIDSLLKRGASEVIGWTGLVDATENDMIVTRVLQESLVNDVDIKQAVESVMIDEYESLYYPTILTYHSIDEEQVNDSQDGKEMNDSQDGKELNGNIGPTDDKKNL